MPSFTNDTPRTVTHCTGSQNYDVAPGETITWGEPDSVLQPEPVQLGPTAAEQAAPTGEEAKPTSVSESGAVGPLKPVDPEAAPRVLESERSPILNGGFSSRVANQPDPAAQPAAKPEHHAKKHHHK